MRISALSQVCSACRAGIRSHAFRSLAYESSSGVTRSSSRSSRLFHQVNAATSDVKRGRHRSRASSDCHTPSVHGHASARPLSTKPTLWENGKSTDVGATTTIDSDSDIIVSGEDLEKLQQNEPEEYIPWYLRDSSATSVPQHSLPGQDMPGLPEHPPEMLEPVVKHVLDNLGLSYLEILDLRTIRDPPPALGANLIMVIATARSERHLHASADKLCRWLRTNYKLRPVADGLMGRNEMKIAVRRLNKRAKMMSAVGAAQETTGDITDGLRSGWVCVNLGQIEGGILPQLAELDADRKFEGFGTVSTKSTLVVQMLTEAKREDLDLEGLWNEAKRRQDRKQRSLTEQQEVPLEENGEDLLWSLSSSPKPTSSTGTNSYAPFEKKVDTSLSATF